jgi:hypothetical protein
MDSDSRWHRLRVQRYFGTKSDRAWRCGGLSEVFVLWGIGATLVGQVAAIVLLARAFSPGHWVRSLFSILSICVSGLALLLVFFFVWLTWFQVHRASGLVLP